MAEHDGQWIRAAAIEMVTEVRGTSDREERALLAATYVQRTYLPAIPTSEQPFALSSLIGILAFDFASLLDAVPEAAAWFSRHALDSATDPG